MLWLTVGEQDTFVTLPKQHRSLNGVRIDVLFSGIIAGSVRRRLGFKCLLFHAHPTQPEHLLDEIVLSSLLENPSA